MMIDKINELTDVMLHGDQDEVEPQQVEAVLEEARKGNKQIQEAAIDILFYAERTEKYFCLLEPEDKQWIETFDNKRAASVLIVGMNTKYRCWPETFTDEETGEPFTHYCYEQAEGTTFERNDAQEMTLFQQLWKWEPSESRDMLTAFQLLLYCSPLDVSNILIAAAEAGGKEAALELGELYRWGSERNGIFVDRKVARHYYKMAGKKYDEGEDVEEYMPYNMDYTVKGEPTTINAVRTLINDLCLQYGLPHRPQFAVEMKQENELSHLLPLLPLMKVLVGATDDYYFGYIMSMTVVDARTLMLHTEIMHEDGLYYALNQAFSGLDIEYAYC